MHKPDTTGGGGGSVMRLDYTVGHLLRVSAIALEMLERLPPEISLQLDSMYRKDLDMAGRHHDMIKADWAKSSGDERLLNTKRIATDMDRLKVIIPHPEQSAALLIQRHCDDVTMRSLYFLVCHHLRFDRNNIGHQDGRFFYDHRSLVVCDSEKEFLDSDSSEPLYFRNSIRYNNEIIQQPGYGPSLFSLLNGREIPLGGRILAVADAADAMTSKREYKANKEWTDAMAELESMKCDRYCPVCVDAITEIPPDVVEEIKNLAA